MKTGVVKWFNNAKGYGFILSDDESKDVFAHYSSIEMDGYRTLRAGQCVAFEAIDGPKGLHAMSIKVLEEVTLTGVPAEQAAAGIDGADGIDGIAASAEREARNVQSDANQDANAQQAAAGGQREDSESPA